MADMNLARPTRHPVAILFLLLATLYGLTYRGNIDVIDEAMMVGLTARIADDGSFHLNPIYPAMVPWGAPPADPNGPIYSKYAPGQSLLALPFYLAGRLVPSHAMKILNDQPFVPLIPFFFAVALNSAATLLTALAVFRAVLLWGYGRRIAAYAVILYGVTTLAWPYAKTFYSEPTTACALAWMLVFAIRYRRDGAIRDGLIAGGCVGIAILLRTSSVIFVPLLLLYLWPRWPAALPGIVAGGVLTLGYNYLRFGSLLESGYEPGFGRAPWEAWLGYLISPSRSVFLFNPVLLLAIPGAIWLASRLRREARLVVALILVQVGLYGTWWAWDGGQSLGPRFLIPALPLAILLIVPAFDRHRWRPALIGLAALGFAMQIACNLANPNDVFYETVNRQNIPLSAVNWQISLSIPANLWTAYSRHAIDSLILRYAPPSGAVAKAILFAALASVLVGGMVWAAKQAEEAGLPTIFPQQNMEDHDFAANTTKNR